MGAVPELDDLVAMPLRRGHAVATARSLRVRRTVIVVESEIRDDADKPLTHAIQSQAVIAPRG